MNSYEAAEELLHGKKLARQLSEFGVRGVDRFLRDVREEMRGTNPFPVIDIEPNGAVRDMVFFFGDIHGDLETLDLIINKFERMRLADEHKDASARLVFLGDYIDRAPKRIPNGGLLTLMRILALKHMYSDDVFLLRGNHEAFSLLPFAPYELPLEILDVFQGVDSERINSQFNGIFSELPLFARTSNGIIASHAGFPKTLVGPVDGIAPDDRETILQILWGDPVESPAFRRGISLRANYRQRDLEDFLGKVYRNLLIRGHDYNTLGYSMYDGRLLTIFTSGRYRERGSGGVLTACTILSENVGSSRDVGLRVVSGGNWDSRDIAVWTVN